MKIEDGVIDILFIEHSKMVEDENDDAKVAEKEGCNVPDFKLL